MRANLRRQVAQILCPVPPPATAVAAVAAQILCPVPPPATAVARTALLNTFLY
jgi:hypothetical protein